MHFGKRNAKEAAVTALTAGFLVWAACVPPGPGDDPDTDDPPDTLPFTGANFGELLIAAMMLLLAGGALVLISRKRTET